MRRAFVVRPDELLRVVALGALLLVAWPCLLALRGPQP
ncbi:MAG: hypothetical protein JWM64_499, partial [Frankiales bacterium]|nr:hypothetical protein [Frankiales bacterium]